MTRIIKGILYDKRIELEEEPGIPPGTLVNVTIESAKMTVEDRRQIVRETAGSWSYDPTIGDVFDEIIGNRLVSRGREVTL